MYQAPPGAVTSRVTVSNPQFGNVIIVHWEQLRTSPMREHGEVSAELEAGREHTFSLTIIDSSQPLNGPLHSCAEYFTFSVDASFRYRVTPKLDGVACLAFVERSDVRTEAWQEVPVTRREESTVSGEGCKPQE